MREASEGFPGAPVVENPAAKAEAVGEGSAAAPVFLPGESRAGELGGWRVVTVCEVAESRTAEHIGGKLRDSARTPPGVQWGGGGAGTRR